MSVDNEAIEALQAFVELHQTSRRHPLSAQAQERYLALDADLRELIDGSTRPVAQAIETKPYESFGPIADDLEISHEDTNIQEIDLHAAIMSTFARPRNTWGLEAYYGGSLNLSNQVPMDTPTTVVDISGNPVELPQRTKDFWDITHVATQPTPASPITDTQAEALPLDAWSETHVEPLPAQTTDTRAQNNPNIPPSPLHNAAGAPAIVYTKAGHTFRGIILRFDSHTGRLTFSRSNQQQSKLEIELADVIAISLGCRPYALRTPREGTHIEVTLINNQHLEGYSNDYRPNGTSLTIVPDKNHKDVDRVWVPAWAVKSIATE
ncbi:MAG: hypothetical protein KTR25_17735 [Myxococcales bacterium]|nr:hypothetical protein [Myxococcales bacterium]